MAIGIGVHVVGVDVHGAHMSRSEQTQALIEQACVDIDRATSAITANRPGPLDALMNGSSPLDRLADAADAFAGPARRSA